MTGAQGKAKKKGWWSSFSSYLTAKKEDVFERLSRMRGCLGWSSTTVGSISAILGEAKHLVPGAALAGESIREALELLSNVAEARERSIPKKPQ